MPGRPIRLITTTLASALAVALSAPAALACYSCGGCAPAYVAPPVVYAPPCGGCGESYAPLYGSPCGARYVAPQPAYRVDLGPTYQMPVVSVEEPVADYIYPRHYPYVSRYSRHWAYPYAHRTAAAVEEEDFQPYGAPGARIDESNGYEDDGYRVRRRSYGAHLHRDMMHHDMMERRHRAIGPRLVYRPMPLRRDVHPVRGSLTGSPHRPNGPQLVR